MSAALAHARPPLGERRVLGLLEETLTAAVSSPARTSGCSSCRRVDKLQRAAVEGNLQRWRPGRDTAALPQTALVQAVDATASTKKSPVLPAVYLTSCN
jgi:outer membrane murein-binding lipoprotein Lpp